MESKVSTRSLASERQWGNQGILGFKPTDKDIVLKELNLIDFSEVIGNDFSINICDLSGGTGDQLAWTKEYLEKIGISSEAYYNEISEERFKKCCQMYKDMHHLNCDFFSIKLGHKEGRALNKKVFSIIRDNPPYMYIERNGRNVRAELEFFLKNSTFDIAGGIHILEIPIHQLKGIRNFLQLICYRYEIFIAKFPAEVFKKYKQVVILCKKRKEPLNDNKEFKKLLIDLEEDNIPFIDKVSEKVMKISKEDFRRTKKIDIFRENKITDKTLKNGLDSVLDSLLSADRKTNCVIRSDEKLNPIIELMRGHISQLLTAGRYDGLMGDLLIKGGANKVVETSESSSEGKTEVVETEVLKPYFEITNKCGDIIYKEF